MKSEKRFEGRQTSMLLIATMLVLTLTVFVRWSYGQDSETILHTFGNTSDGIEPWAGVIFDAAGNLYGTASEGGSNLNGIVYELSPSASGWQETILYSFKGKSDGGRPFGGVVFDAAGNLYGTGYIGGENKAYPCQPFGCGVIYELTPVAGGGWMETVIHTFSTAMGGFGPVSGLTIDASGNLYGTTIYGGQVNTNNPTGYGLVYELSPSPVGWKYKLLHAFTNGVDGSVPYAGVTFDAGGNLYAAGTFGGNPTACSGNSCGAVIKLSPTSSGPWRASLVHDFVGKDGGNPYGGVAVDAAGNVYATTQDAGAHGGGSVVEFSPSGSGWSENLLYSFDNRNGAAGYHPEGNLITDSSGNVYGTTTEGGGMFFEGGTVFQLSPSGSAWDMNVLYVFGESEGSSPISGVILDSAGNLYGTTSFGPGGFNYGNVYELTP